MTTRKFANVNLRDYEIGKEKEDAYPVNVCQRKVGDEFGVLRKFQAMKLSLSRNCQIFMRKNDTLWIACGPLHQE